MPKLCPLHYQTHLPPRSPIGSVCCVVYCTIILERQFFIWRIAKHIALKDSPTESSIGWWWESWIIYEWFFVRQSSDVRTHLHSLCRAESAEVCMKAAVGGCLVRGMNYWCCRRQSGRVHSVCVCVWRCYAYFKIHALLAAIQSAALFPFCGSQRISSCSPAHEFCCKCLGWKHIFWNKPHCQSICPHSEETKTH